MNRCCIRTCKGSPHKPGAFVADIVRRVRQTVRQSAFPNLELHMYGVEQPSSSARREVSWDENPTVDDLSGAAIACDLATAVDGDCDTFCWWTGQRCL